MLSVPSGCYVVDYEERYAQIVTRLTRVRGALTDEQFNKLVADVIRMQARFDEIHRSMVGRLLPPKPDS